MDTSDNYIPKEDLEEIKQYLSDIEHEQTEHCWVTGEYSDECDCEFCDHKHEYIGYKGDDDDWED